MATCGELQIGNYTQTLWGQLQDSSGQDTLNGFIEAACPFVCKFFNFSFFLKEIIVLR